MRTKGLSRFTGEQGTGRAAAGLRLILSEDTTTERVL